MEQVTILRKIQLENNEELLLARNSPILVALSGGADSVALLRVLLTLGIDCHAAHCNFHLRGEESMRDERFVRDLCEAHHVPLSVHDVDVATWQHEHGGSIEMACREARYAWFEQERQRRGCALIAVAHHSDDQVETFFLNLLRGTGTRGLAGMQRLNGNIWRPLLGVSRQDILDYLDYMGQDYVTDSTNAENDYRRNQLRNIILPVMQEQFPHARDRIVDTMNNLRNDHDLLTSLVNEIMPDERHIDLSLLFCHSHAPTLLYHRIRHLGFNRDQCDQAVGSARDGHSGRQFIGKGFVLHVNRQALDIEPINEQDNIEIPIDLTASVTTPVQLTISHNNAPFSPLMCDGKHTVAFRTDLIKCKRIVLRHWQMGDRIRPYGLNGSKLVSDVFADFKLGHMDKRAAWLLEADGEILWVLGYRASSLYTVKPESQDYILLKYQKSAEKLA